jgi:hypothetical protein
VKTVLRLVLLAVLAGAGFWLWTVFFPSPEKIVLKKISELAANANITSADGTISRAAKASSVVGQFATNAEIVLEATGEGQRTFSGREEINEAAMGGFATVPSLKVEFLDAVARVEPDKQNASVTCTARVSAGDNKDFGISALRFEFQKIDGSWLITRVETVKTLH